jgi:hypothetical protein
VYKTVMVGILILRQAVRLRGVSNFFIIVPNDILLALASLNLQFLLSHTRLVTNTY